MAYVWKPVKSPPSARDVSLYSSDIQKVLEVIRSQHEMKHPLFHNYPKRDSESQQNGPKKYSKACSSKWVNSSGEETSGPHTQIKKSPFVRELSLQHTKANLKGEQCDHKNSRVCGITVGNDAISSDIVLGKSHVTEGRMQNQETGTVSSSSCGTVTRSIQKSRQLSCKDRNESLKERSATQTVKIQLPARKQYHQSNSVTEQEDLDVDMPTGQRDNTSYRSIVLDDVDDEQRVSLLNECLAATEILIQLSYGRGLTQLQEKPALEKFSNSATGGFSDTVHSILMAVSCQNLKSPPVNQSGDSQWLLLSIPILKVSSSQKAWCQQFLSSVLSSGVRKICYDAQEVISVIMSFCQPDCSSVASEWLCLDPQVACWLLDPDNPPVSFSDLVKTVLDCEPSGGDQKSIRAGRRNPTDVSDFVLLSQCMRQLHHRLTEANLWNLFLQVEMPLIPLLAGMEQNGIQVNPQKFYYSSAILKSRTSQLEQLAHSKAGRAFQLNSHVQLRKILFDELKLDKTLTSKQMERTAGQNLKSTSENVLIKLHDVHPLPGIILEYRKMQKLKSTYVDGFIDFVKDNKIHCTWEQTAAVSGRLQSTNPNVQNIPKQPVSVNLETSSSREGAHRILHMREPFVSQKGHSLISADFQSIELRLLAHFSNDDLLLEIFKDEDQTDIFIQMASQWLGIPSDEVRDEDRERTKRIVYSIVYGAGSEKISEILKVDKTTAKSFTNSFIDKFSGIRRFTHQTISQCRRLGCVRSLLQRRRLIKNISSSNTPQRLHAERQAVNFIIQGSAADVCKLAMLTTTREFAKRPHLKARLLIQIHDELLFEVPDNQINECKALIASAMESVANIPELGVQLKTCIPVSLSVGKDWGHLVKA